MYFIDLSQIISSIILADIIFRLKICKIAFNLNYYYYIYIFHISFIFFLAGSDIGPLFEGGTLFKGGTLFEGGTLFFQKVQKWDIIQGGTLFKTGTLFK